LSSSAVLLEPPIDCGGPFAERNEELADGLEVPLFESVDRLGDRQIALTIPESPHDKQHGFLSVGERPAFLASGVPRRGSRQPRLPLCLR